MANEMETSLRKQLEDTGCLEAMYKQISNSGIAKLISLACEGNINQVNGYLNNFNIPEMSQAIFWRECYRIAISKK